MLKPMNHLDDKHLGEIHDSMRSFRTRFLALCFSMLISAIALAYVGTSDFEKGGAVGLAIASIFYYNRYAIARDITDKIAAEIDKRARQATLR